MAEGNTSLMKKTKAQLIEIILRKDSVEQECRTEINNLNKTIKGYDDDMKGTLKQLEEYKNTVEKQRDVIKTQASFITEKENIIEGLKSQYDLAATEVAEAKEYKNTYKTYVKCVGIICVLLIILIFILFVF